MNLRSSIPGRRIAALGTALLGLGLLGLDLAPRFGPRGALLMVWSFFRAEGGTGIGAWLPSPQPVEVFADALRDHLFPALLLALFVSVGLGLATAAVIADRMSRRASLGLRLACIFVWAIALDPATALYVATRDVQSATRYLSVGDLFRGLGLGAGWVAFLLWRGSNRDTPVEPRAPADVESRPGWSLLLAMLTAALVPSVISWWALDRSPLTNDEHAYLMQARLFADGYLYRDLGELAEFFPSPQTVIEHGRLFLFTLPGHAVTLTPGTLIGMPELLPRLLAMLAVALTWSLAVQLSVARPNWAAWCLALSPAYLGVESLYLSNATSLPFALLFVWCALKALDALALQRERKALLLAALGGFAISMAFVTRPVTAVALAAPVVFLLFRERRRGVVALVGVAICAALPLCMWLLSVNHTLTGSAFHTAFGVYDRAENADYGQVDLRTAASISAFNLARLSVWSCGVAPALLLPILGYLLAARGPRTWLVAAMPVSLFAFYALHPFHGIPWVGPVYLSDALPALALLFAQGFFVVETDFGQGARRALCALCIAGSALLLASHFRLAHEEIGLRQLPYAEARARGITRGVVFVRMSTSRELRLYPLHPPRAGEEIIFARDLGPRNADLLRALGSPPAWLYDPGTEAMRAL